MSAYHAATHIVTIPAIVFNTTRYNIGIYKEEIGPRSIKRVR